MPNKNKIRSLAIGVMIDSHAKRYEYREDRGETEACDLTHV